jgi:ferric-dicitrate binding protein FerR (iron transport regulator)
MGVTVNFTPGPNEALLTRILRVSGTWEVIGRLPQEEAWLAVRPRIDSGLSVRWLLRLAASFLLLGASLGGFYVSQNVRISTQAAEHREIRLPDGSTVNLNSNSRVAFNRLAWHRGREVELSGEAFFSVNKGESFKVIAPEGNITVLGTQFNVYARNNDFEVACTEGRVRVESKGTSVLLTSGLTTRLTGRLSEPEGYVQSPSSWTSGEFYFEQSDLRRVIETLEQQYGVEVTADVKGQRTYTGFFTNRNLEEALILVCRPLGLTYQVVENHRILITENTNNQQ